jgi:protein TonB
MEFRSNIILSVVIHSTIIMAAAAVAGRDAPSRVPANYVVVKLLEYSVQKGPVSGDKKKGPKKEIQAGPRRPDMIFPEAPPPISEQKETAPPIADEKRHIKESTATANDISIVEKDPPRPHQGRGTAVPAGETVQVSISAAAMSKGKGDRNDKKNGTIGRDSGAISAIRASIEKSKSYPAFARMRGIEGTVTTGFRISATGHPEDIRILKSSGSEILDAAAKNTVIKASPYPVVTGDIEVPITFRLQKE